MLLGWALQSHAREVIPLNEGWRFYFKSENTSDNARHVRLPHSWNNDPRAENHLIETTGNYLHPIYIPEEWAGKRLFIKFYGVQTVAEFFVNGHYVGDHMGSSAAFTFEITDKLNFGQENLMLLSVSNTSRNDVLPTGSDMNFYGGIYRPVELIITDRVAVSPLYLGTDGILVHPEKVSGDKVEGNIDIHLTAKGLGNYTMSVEMEDADRQLVFHKQQRIKTDNRPVNVPFDIASPRLWSPSSPELYTVRVTIRNSDNEQVDCMEVRTGFRKVSISPARRFEINDTFYEIKGVTLYHDNELVCGNLQEADYDQDLATLSDLGANAIRSAVMPHAPYLYDRCDEDGILAWIDLPFHRTFLCDISYIPSPRYEQNGLQQVREIVAQNLNHPSVVMWGLFSRLSTRGDDPLKFLRRLNNEVRQMDPSRPTVALSDQDGDINFITDLVVWQQSLGWERGSVDDVVIWRDMLRRDWAHLLSGVAYGGAGMRGHKSYTADSFSSNGVNLSEERQTRFLEGYERNLASDSLFWGKWINNLFDYGSVRRPYGVNCNGLVAINHRDRKDAYYLYRALWNKEQATLHIADKHNTIRIQEPRSFHVYSSVGAPVLTINQDTIPILEQAPCQYYTAPIELEGKVKVRVSAAGIADSMTLFIGKRLKLKPMTGLLRRTNPQTTDSE